MSKLRRRVIPLSLAAALLLLAFIPFSYAGQLLRQGDSGPEVLFLQNQLRQLGYLAAPATGYFGPLTAAAVSRLQADYRLVPDGIVGPLTRALLDGLLGAPQKPLKTVMGYYTGEEWPLPSSLETLKAHGDALTCVALFSYRLHPLSPGRLEAMDYLPASEIQQVLALAREKKIKVLVLVHNLLYGSGIRGRDVARLALSDPQRRHALVMNIFNILKEKGFDGVEIDIEDLYPQDGQLFNQFLAELSAQLKPAGYVLSVALPARLSDDQAGWGSAFDYRTAARYADQVVIMAYDEHGLYSGPGPIASLPWVEKAVRYTVERILPQKILLGIPAYGFDWNGDGQPPRYLSYRLACETASRYGTPVRWDERAQAPYLKYIDENGSPHELWFENASSWAGKLDLVARYGLKGIAVWRLGLEDPQGWKVIGDKFTVEKG
ncbi:glycosyl hydrolase family 18 protein [Desulfovirgula thermocuniculi]|uniref:glycosyl hydrolase family 18 protein n=1 Tax=Desulfovirgula thermocuniculi TaxID=348842 RepID=UPI0003FB33D0|nr:glycosyl hydrolase family 18 protein [Desulfovirgula thermocuniculi]